MQCTPSLTVREFDDWLADAGGQGLLVCVYLPSSLEPVMASLDQVRDAFGETLSILVFDLARSGELAAAFGISGTPTLLLFRGRAEVLRVLGHIGGEDLLAMLRGHLAAA